LDESLDPARKAALSVPAAIVLNDRAGQIFDHQHCGLIDERMRRGKDFGAHDGAVLRVLAHDLLFAGVVLNDALVLAAVAFDQMLVGQRRQRLAALVAHFVGIALGRQEFTQS
jgi:hypothetical protein